MPESPKTRDILQTIGHELKENPPGILAKTRRQKGPVAAQDQKVAILLNKARKAGAKIPGKKSAF